MGDDDIDPPGTVGTRAPDLHIGRGVPSEVRCTRRRRRRCGSARGSEQWVDGFDKGFAASTLRRLGEEVANAVMRMDTPSANAASGRVIAEGI